jgi:hypothetical protein
MEFSRQAVWAKLKTPAEFITRLIAIIGLIYGLGWVLDDVVAHFHIRVAHNWWAYNFWHAWWWVLAPVLMVAAARLWPRRILAQLLWAAGAIWLLLLASGACAVWWIALLTYLAARYGWVAGGALSLAAMVPFTLAVVLAGILVDLIRKRSHLFDRLVIEICWMPDLKRKPELSRNAP